MDRKEFIQTSCSACMLMTAGFFLSAMPGCTPKYSVFKTEVVDKKLTLPLSAFKQSSLQLVRPKGWYYDIAVEKNNDNTYTALLLQCTHQENQLTPDGNGFHCNLHGSQFDSEGNVRKGPAERPLQRYRTYMDMNSLIIEILKSPEP